MGLPTDISKHVILPYTTCLDTYNSATPATHATPKLSAIPKKCAILVQNPQKNWTLWLIFIYVEDHMVKLTHQNEKVGCDLRDIDEWRKMLKVRECESCQVTDHSPLALYHHMNSITGRAFDKNFCPVTTWTQSLGGLLMWGFILLPHEINRWEKLWHELLSCHHSDSTAGRTFDLPPEELNTLGGLFVNHSSSPDTETSMEVDDEDMVEVGDTEILFHLSTTRVVMSSNHPSLAIHWECL